MARIVPKLNLNKTPELVDNNSLIFAKNVRFNANGLSSDFGFDEVLDLHEEIVGIIPYNTSFYVFTSSNTIHHYDELTGIVNICKCNWHWSGGKIDGICTINLNGDVLLTIAEHHPTMVDKVPLKIINLNESRFDDDESIYTQSPKVPFINLINNSNYRNTIPAGTYQFFVRYEIRKDFYTDWFPASKELFAGCKKSLLTNQGGLNYIDTTIDSDTSFVLSVEKPIIVKGFKSFQLGFIISHDNEVYARAYKHYSLDTNTIYFDYDTEYIEEIDVRDILSSPYSLYNVGNVTSFKNKLYISNYNESDINPDLEYFARSIDINLEEISNDSVSLFEGREINFDTQNPDYIVSIATNDQDEQISENNPVSISEIIEYSLNQNKDWIASAPEVVDQSNFKLINQFGVKTSITKATSQVIVTDNEGVPTPQTVIDNTGHYISDLVDDNVIDTTIGINPDTNIPELGVYEVKKNYNGSVDTFKVYSIEDVITLVKNNVSKINKNTGKLVDTNNNQVSFRITYYYKTSPSSQHYWVAIILISFSISLDGLVINYNTTNTYSLVPDQGYNFYVHLVKDNGEYTNGYLINNEHLIVDEPSGESNTHDFPAIYPTFTFKTNIPEGYVACFISIAHVKNKVAHVFNIEALTAAGPTGVDSYLGSCLELDTQLYPWLNDIPVKNGEHNYKINYRASYDSELLTTFGGAGECVFEDTTVTDTYGFIVMPYEANPEYLNSVRCTPYIRYEIDESNYTYDEYNSLNLLGYLCRVKKPLRTKNLTRYFSGSDIYLKSSSANAATGSSYGISVVPLEDNSTEWGAMYDSVAFTVYSNFNLNYLSLSEKPTPRIITKSVTEDGTTTTTSHLLLARDSSILSDIYELVSMYKSYTRKLYYPYDTYNKLTRFDNTIRSSILEGDEAKVNLYKFRATDYYNVPTDKGKIVNLVAVGDNILVHTQDSIYKFSGQNSLTAAGGEDVQIKESEVFDTGIQELFGSEFGYAGLADKEHQILSEFGYTFWDRDSGRIYIYTGNAQIKVLSDDISKLLKYDIIENIHLADDYYNNRIFVCIEFSNGKTATLSYDFVAKSFISLHDFAFAKGFKTKTKCYFIYNDLVIYKVGTELGTYEKLEIEDILYPNYSRISGTDTIHDCVVDIIYNDRFESIKTLNAISWICNKIVGFNAEVNMAEEAYENNNTNPEERYKGDILRLYTDSCMTDDISLIGRSNDSINDYKNVRYNQGKWTYNYFRNIIHRSNDQIGNRPFRQDDTLIYGKYIVARFIFNRTVDFKFEDVTVNTSNDYNV